MLTGLPYPATIAAHATAWSTSGKERTRPRPPTRQQLIQVATFNPPYARMFCSSPVSTRMASLQAVSSRGRRALLVEDNVITRVVVSKLMKDQGIALEEAENGKAAVESVKEGKSYDLILMDREMSVMDGHEATKQLRLLGVKTPIVALSSDSQQCDRDLFLKAGADEFVEKPLTKDKLARILSKYGLQ